MYLDIENICVFLSPRLWGISTCIPVMEISGEKNSKILIVLYMGRKIMLFLFFCLSLA